MAFFENVVAYCEKENLSMRAFEIKCGLQNGTSQGWKKGGNPSLNTLSKIVEATKVPLKKWLA